MLERMAFPQSVDMTNCIDMLAALMASPVVTAMMLGLMMLMMVKFSSIVSIRKTGSS